MSVLDTLSSDYRDSHPVGVLLPAILIPEEEYRRVGLPINSSNVEFLKALVKNALKAKGFMTKPNRNEYFERAKYELEVFEELGFVDYILLNWDILGFCHKNNIPTGFGRGSGAGSLVLYLVDVTRVDPIEYGLIFERFVSRARSNKIEKDGQIYFDGSLLPDVDNDIAFHKRQLVIDYINQKYQGHTAKILTFNTLASRLCMKECAKIVDAMPEIAANRISDHIPDSHGRVFGLEEAAENSDSFKEFVQQHKKAYSIACKLEDLIKNTGVHPSGIAISNQLIGSIMPLHKTKDNDLVTGYDMQGVTELCVKFDILGLRTLSVVDEACSLAGIKNFLDINPEDGKIYEYFQEFKNPHGLFQIEASTNQQVCEKVKPANLEQLSAVIALARPGALAYVDEYTKFAEPEAFGSQALLDILKPTSGVPLYQEQAMAIANKVFGLTLDDAELIRRVIGKKKRSEMPKWKEKIYSAAKAKGLGTEIADFYWKLLEDSSNYSFNKSHSCSYACLTAITTYLKTQHPLEFFTALLNMAIHESNPHEDIARICRELPCFNIRLFPPCLYRSEMKFMIEGSNIRYGLAAIRGVNEKSMEVLQGLKSAKMVSKYDLFLTTRDCGINIGVLNALVGCGMFERFDADRCKLMLEANVFNNLSDREKRNFMALGKKYNHSVLATMKDVFNNSFVADDGKKLFSPKRIHTLTKKLQPYKQMYLANSTHVDMANWWFEQKLLGYSFSGSLASVFTKGELVDSRKINASDSGVFQFVGMVVEAKKKLAKKSGRQYLWLVLSDEFGEIKCLVMDSKDSHVLSMFLKFHKVPEEGDLVFIEGKKSDTSLFLQTIKPVQVKVFMNKRELNETDDAHIA
jgi:DNA polymerase-3 subunit alpha